MASALLTFEHVLTKLVFGFKRHIADVTLSRLVIVSAVLLQHSSAGVGFGAVLAAVRSSLLLRVLLADVLEKAGVAS